MGERGPAPRSDFSFRGRPVVVCGGLPAVRWPTHPLARAGLVALHRLIASEMLGRALTRQERVRWRDGNVWNWDPSNLEVVGASAALAAYRARSAAPKAKRAKR